MTRWRVCICFVALLLAAPAVTLAQGVAYTTKTVNLRAGPDRSYPLVLRVVPGTQLQVFGCLDDYSWCDVGLGLNRGWIWAGNLTYPYENHRVAIYQYGPTLGIPIIVFSVGSYWDNYYRGQPWYSNRAYWYSRPPSYRPPRPPSWNRPPPQIQPPRPRPPQVVQPPRPQPPPPRPTPRPPPRPTTKPMPAPGAGGPPPGGGRPPSGGGRPPPQPQQPRPQPQPKPQPRGPTAVQGAPQTN
jgi:uncharacterized protein YraI